MAKKDIKKETKDEIEMEVTVIESVDFSDPKAVIEYGQNIIEGISDILANTAVISSPVSELAIDASEIEGMTKLDDSLNEVETSLAKRQPAIVLGVRKVLAKVGLSKPKTEVSYQTKYNEYCEMIDTIIKAVDTQRNASVQDMNLRKAMIDELLPRIEELEQAINSGIDSKEEYDAETESMKEGMFTEEDQDPNMLYEIQNREQISEVFNYRLDELKRALVLYKEQVQSYRLQQSTEATFLMGCTSFLNSTAPILKAQGSVMAFNYQQQKRLDTMHSLNQAANTAISENALLLQKNAQAAVDLMVDNGINVETLERLSAAIEQGIKIFKQGQEQKQRMIESNKKHLEELSAVMDSYKEQVTLLEAHLDATSDAQSMVKRLNDRNH